METQSIVADIYRKGAVSLDVPDVCRDLYVQRHSDVVRAGADGGGAIAQKTTAELPIETFNHWARGAGRPQEAVSSNCFALPARVALSRV